MRIADGYRLRTIGTFLDIFSCFQEMQIHITDGTENIIELEAFHWIYYIANDKNYEKSVKKAVPLF